VSRRRIAALAAVAPLLAAGCFGLVSADVPLALAWGRAIADAGGPPATNVLSAVHGAYPVQLDKWAFQLAGYRVHSLAGAPGLVALRLLLLAACGRRVSGGARGRRPWCWRWSRWRCGTAPTCAQSW